ncbi:MAG: hypothetical protein QOD90_5439 [Mycobacterium sp.]|jgi:hypothetical protein|nr:hypothetical protein [Mycobacterium sp.]
MHRLHRLLVIGVSGIALASGLLAFGVATTPRSESLACDMNLVPWDPYHQTCGIPNQIPTAPGQAPGAGAIIACRDIPGCLSQAVNGPQLVAVPRPDTRVRQSR